MNSAVFLQHSDKFQLVLVWVAREKNLQLYSWDGSSQPCSVPTLQHYVASASFYCTLIKIDAEQKPALCASAFPTTHYSSRGNALRLSKILNEECREGGIYWKHTAVPAVAFCEGFIISVVHNTTCFHCCAGWIALHGKLVIPKVSCFGNRLFLSSIEVTASQLESSGKLLKMNVVETKW